MRLRELVLGGDLLVVIIVGYLQVDDLDGQSPQLLRQRETPGLVERTFHGLSSKNFSPFLSCCEKGYSEGSVTFIGIQERVCLKTLGLEVLL